MSARPSEKSVSDDSPCIGTELLAQARPQLDAILDQDVLTPQVDVAGAALTVIGVMPEIEKHRAALEARFGERATTVLDGLVPAARVLLAASAQYVVAAEKNLEPDAERLRAIRDRLVRAATVLVERGMISRKSLGRLVGGGGYLALVRDTKALASWFRVQSEVIRAAAMVTDEELGSAYAVAEAFHTDLARRDHAHAGTAAAVDDRARAYTLLFRTYSGVRKMLTYLRWHHGDADAIAPSLFVHSRVARSRSRRRRVRA